MALWTNNVTMIALHINSPFYCWTTLPSYVTFLAQHEVMVVNAKLAPYNLQSIAYPSTVDNIHNDSHHIEFWVFELNCDITRNNCLNLNSSSISDAPPMYPLWELLPYQHGQFGTQVMNNYFNYYKVILQLQQYFNQLWAVV